MSPIPLVIEVTMACSVAAFFLNRYGNWRRQHVMVTVATFIAWYFSLMIIFILPLDVSNTWYRQCLKDHSTTTVSSVEMSIATSAVNDSLPVVDGSSSATLEPVPASVECKEPWSFVKPVVLTTLWHIVYWSSQFLTWLLLPLMQSYARAGDFTVTGKLRTALIENAIYYGTYLLIFGICLIYVAASPGLHLDGMQLKVLAATASNTWGLFLLVLLLGYGLVEVPRSCWSSANNSYTLQHLHFKLAKLSVEKSEAEEALEDTMSDVKKAVEAIRYNDPLRKFADIILQKCPEELRGAVRLNREDYEDYVPGDALSERALAKLHKRVIETTQTAQRTQVQWHMLMEQALSVEDVIANEIAPGRSSFVRSFGRYEGIWQRCYSPTLEWYWRCRVRGYMMKVAAVLVAVVAAMVVWSECLFFITDPVLSLFAFFIKLAKQNYDYLAIEMISSATISFLCICTYFTIFRLRILNYYYLASHHQTNENSLIFSGMLLCRLTPPLCLNFLGLIHMDTHVTKKYGLEETAYTQIMGHMDVISFIANGFNIYFPIAIVLFCIATYFNIAARFLHCLGFQQFVGDDDITTELVDEGRELLKRERRRRQRLEDSDSRKRNWQERFEASQASNFHDDESASKRDNRRSQRQLTARSPVENDRAELLKEAEPMDYIPSNSRYDNDPFADEVVQNNGGGWRYQGSQSKSSWNSAPPAPQRGIFDDI